MTSSLQQFVSKVSPEARNLALSYIRKYQPITTRDLYHIMTPEGSAAESGNPVVHSMSHLKKRILPELEGMDRVKKVHSREPPPQEHLDMIREELVKSRGKTAHLGMSTQSSMWRWQIMEPAEKKVVRKVEKPFGVEVGVDADVSHLNKRRQRAREEKVARDVKWMRQLKRAQAAIAQPST